MASEHKVKIQPELARLVDKVEWIERM